MKHFITTILLLCTLLGGMTAKNKVTVLNCSRGAETSFAIVTDRTTFEKCKAELTEYRNVLESEGLGTYIVAADWNSPDEVRAQIRKLAGKKPRLEGIVLIGDIPVVLVRQAQYMTTAFKMNEQKYPEIESSVPSDRFYDDLDLEFDFIKKDPDRHNIFYYRLSEKGSQVLQPDIYSARMKVPEVMQGDRHEILRRYLRKVVTAHREQNTLDRLTFFAGHGYNSDCLTIWRQKPVVFREHFPYAFAKASQNRFLNFRQKMKMKGNLTNELQREGTDLFIFSEHGAYDTQYLTGSVLANSFATNYDHLLRSVGSMFRQYKGTPDEEPFLKEVLDSVFKLPRSCVSDSALARYERLDSIDRADANMVLDEIMKIRSNPRFILFNACYNGSFHNEEGYVAGCHVFGDGQCVVAQGNTVNVLQDKWEDKLIGYLSMGERVGMWQKEITFLESHLIGDPTFRFRSHNAKEEAECARLHRDLVFSENDPETWRAYLKSENPILRAAGITHLCDNAGDWSKEALELFQNDGSWVVRLTALNALGKYMNGNTLTAIKAAWNDPYEATVRTACRLAGGSCEEAFVEDLQNIQETRPDLQRVQFLAVTAENVLSQKKYRKQIQRAADRSVEESRRIDAVRSFRNNRVSAAADSLLSIVADADDALAVRTVAAEALGWYNQSVRKEEIASALQTTLKKEKTMPERVRKEVQKTIKRLRWE